MKRDIPTLSLFDEDFKRAFAAEAETIETVEAVEVTRRAERKVPLAVPSSKKGLQITLYLQERLLEYVRDHFETFICDMQNLESAPHIRAKLFQEVVKMVMPKDFSANYAKMEQTSRAILQKIFKQIKD